MPSWLPIVVLSAIALLVLAMMMRRVKLSLEIDVKKTLADFGAINAFAREKHERIGEYLRANWSGAPEALAPVLQSLVEELERDIRAKGISLDHDTVKLLVERSVHAHRLASGGDLRKAMSQVA